jgi:hypothetical protein
MGSPLRAVAASAAFALLAGAALWPPRAVYWHRLAAAVGDAVTLALVGLLALALGAAFTRVASVAVRPFVVGAAVAYVVGMGAIAALLAPDSPVHLVWYAALGACLVGGAALQERVGRSPTPAD